MLEGLNGYTTIQTPRVQILELFNKWPQLID